MCIPCRRNWCQKALDLDFVAVLKKSLKRGKRHVTMKNKTNKKKTDEKTSKKFINEKNVAHIFVT